MSLTWNDGLRRIGEPVDYSEVIDTPEGRRTKLNEWIRCAEDIIYFAEHYCWINTIDDGVVLVKLRDYQKSLFKSLYDEQEERRHRIIMSSRQSGKTESMSIYVLHYILFHKEKTVAILANREKLALEILSSLKMKYERLPKFLQQGITTLGWTASKIELENGCKVITGATSMSSIRGYTIDRLILDEFAIVPQNIADNFFASVYPTVSSGKTSRIIITSTPLGMNLFYDIWQKATRKENDFVPIKIAYWEVPGRDEKWKKKMISDIGPVRFRQEFECAFLGSSQLLISPEYIERYGVNYKEPIELRYNGAMQIFERPIKGAKYVLGVDSAAGNGGDHSVVQVLRIDSPTFIEQVAVYRANDVSYTAFGLIVKEISDMYNDAYIMLENNDIGAQVANYIWYELECDRLVNLIKHQLGIRSSSKSKVAACLNMKRLFELGYLILRDTNTINEISTFVEVRPNVFKAQEGAHDDLVTSLMWGLYFLQTPYYEDENSNATAETSSETEQKPQVNYDGLGKVFTSYDMNNDPNSWLW